MINKKVLSNDRLEMGPKVAYQCNCACPKSTPATLNRNPKNDKSGVDGEILVTMDIKTI